MSFAAYKMMHCPTGVENCAPGFISHSAADFIPRIPSIQTDDLDSDWSATPKPTGPVPNLIVTAANVLEIYTLRVQEETARPPIEAQRCGVLAGVSGAYLELVCHYGGVPRRENSIMLHGNLESVGVLSPVGIDGGKRRESINLTFQDAKISVLEFDDSIHGLRTSTLHCFEGPDWLHLKRGREYFARSPLVKVDPQGRCAGVLVYGLQMVVLKAAEVILSR